MPLVAERNGVRVNALEIGPDEWRSLRGSTDLVMPECGARAVPKTSSLGNQFFAHYASSGCLRVHSPESAGHLLLKKIITESVNSTNGWTAQPEVRHPEGRWVADVMAVGPSGERIAFEVQLSNQSDQDYFHRTRRYESDGIRTVWVNKVDLRRRGGVRSFSYIVIPLITVNISPTDPKGSECAVDSPHFRELDDPKHVRLIDAVRYFLSPGCVWFPSVEEQDRILEERHRRYLEWMKEMKKEKEERDRAKARIEAPSADETASISRTQSETIMQPQPEVIEWTEEHRQHKREVFMRDDVLGGRTELYPDEQEILRRYMDREIGGEYKDMLIKSKIARGGYGG